MPGRLVHAQPSHCRPGMLLPLLPLCYTMGSGVAPFDPQRVSEPSAQSAEDLELRAHVENALSAKLGLLLDEFSQFACL